MTRYGVLLSCASEMVTPGLVDAYQDGGAAAVAATAAQVQGIKAVVCRDDGDGWLTAGNRSPREWLAQFQ